MIDEKELAILRGASGRLTRFVDLQCVVRNPRTLAFKLRKMEAEGLLVKVKGLYKLTPAGEEATVLLEAYKRLVRGSPDLQNFDRVPHAVYAPLLKDYSELLWKRYGERLEGVVLFGSVARGDWRKESDIDLLVVVEGWRSLKEWDRVEELYALKTELARCDSYAAGVRSGFYPAIHELPLDPAELESLQPFHLDISIDGIVLYERKGAMREFMDIVKGWATRAGSRRIVMPNGSFYWVLAPVKFGEVVELGNQP